MKKTLPKSLLLIVKKKNLLSKNEEKQHIHLLLI